MQSSSLNTPAEFLQAHRELCNEANTSEADAFVGFLHIPSNRFYFIATDGERANGYMTGEAHVYKVRVSTALDVLRNRIGLFRYPNCDLLPLEISYLKQYRPPSKRSVKILDHTGVRAKIKLATLSTNLQNRITFIEQVVNLRSPKSFDVIKIPDWYKVVESTVSSWSLLLNMMCRPKIIGFCALCVTFGLLGAAGVLGAPGLFTAAAIGGLGLIGRHYYATATHRDGYAFPADVIPSGPMPMRKSK